MFATIKNLIPEPRQADHPRHYVGRHRRADPAPAAAPVSPAPLATETPTTPAPIGTDNPIVTRGPEKPAEETAAV
jgi:hypothetical protein